jgi:hypothetical protein
MSDGKLTIGVLGTGAGNMRALGGDGVAPIKDPITATPVIQGKHGRAWLCDNENGRRIKNIDPQDDGTLAHWIIEAPWAHPVWHSYSLVLIHLRPMRDHRRTMIYLDDATHELWLYAINPDSDRNKMLATGIVDADWLQPKNYADQFIEISDELAQGRIKQTIHQICDGKLSPDTDYQSDWVRLFGGHMMKNRPHRRPPKIR